MILGNNENTHNVIASYFGEYDEEIIKELLHDKNLI